MRHSHSRRDPSRDACLLSALQRNPPLADHGSTDGRTSNRRKDARQKGQLQRQETRSSPRSSATHPPVRFALLSFACRLAHPRSHATLPALSLESSRADRDASPAWTPTQSPLSVHVPDPVRQQADHGHRRLWRRPDQPVVTGRATWRRGFVGRAREGRRTFPARVPSQPQP